MIPSFERFLLTVRTARHFRARQVWNRAQRAVTKRARPRRVAATWDVNRARQACDALGGLGPVDEGDHVRTTAAGWRAGALELLGQRVEVARSWREPWPTPLIEYHMHYHDALADVAWAARESGNPALARDVAAGVQAWIAAWRGGGWPAWDPYPIAVRVVNWMRMLSWGALDMADAAVIDAFAAQLDVLVRDI